MSQAASVKKAVKRGLTRRLMERVGMGDSDSDDEERGVKSGVEIRGGEEGEDTETLKGEGTWANHFIFRNGFEACSENGDVKEYKSSGASDAGSGRATVRGRARAARGMRRAERDLEMGCMKGHDKLPEKTGKDDKGVERKGRGGEKSIRTNFQLSRAAGMTSMSMLEQVMPADAVLPKENADEVSRKVKVWLLLLINGSGLPLRDS